MAEEGIIQVFAPLDGSPMLVGVVGALQLDVLSARLDAEYGLPVEFENVPFLAGPLGDGGKPRPTE